jgi:putative tricarboxylic transport membrane protein
MNHKQEIGTGLFFLSLSVFYIWHSFAIQSFDPFGNSFITSQAMPQVIGGLVFVVSAIHIAIHFGKLLKEKTPSQDTGTRAVSAGVLFDKSFWMTLITVLLIAAYIFCFTRLGFILSSILFLLAQIFLLTPAEKRWKFAAFIVCFSIVAPVGLYFMFTKVLSMFLPRGLLG